MLRRKPIVSWGSVKLICGSKTFYTPFPIFRKKKKLNGTHRGQEKLYHHVHFHWDRQRSNRLLSSFDVFSFTCITISFLGQLFHYLNYPRQTSRLCIYIYSGHIFFFAWKQDDSRIPGLERELFKGGGCITDLEQISKCGLLFHTLPKRTRRMSSYLQSAHTPPPPILAVTTVIIWIRANP